MADAKSRLSTMSLTCSARVQGFAQQCPMARGNWSLSCLECELSGDGTCLLGCANCKGKNAKCDLSVCADLSLTDGGSRFVCNKSGKLCPVGSSSTTSIVTETLEEIIG